MPRTPALQTSSLLSSLVLGLALASGCATASPEAGHPNLIAARQATQQAIDSLHAAQVANAHDLNGHAAKAEQLLAQALQEIRLAAEAANAKR